MTWRRSNKRGANPVHIEVARPDELPAGVAALCPSATTVIKRDALGRLADVESARELGARGGAAKAGKTRLARRNALGEVFADPRFEPYAKAAGNFARAHVAELARSVGGGTCGNAPSSVVRSAALQLAASRFAFEVLGDLQLGSRLANDSRQNLLAAHELCAREAAARPATTAESAPWLEDE